MVSIKLLKGKLLNRVLNSVEKIGNALPHPASLFAIFALLILVLSAVAFALDWNAVHPGTNEEIQPVNLLSVAGLHRIITEMVTNFREKCRHRNSYCHYVTLFHCIYYCMDSFIGWMALVGITSRTECRYFL